MHWTLMIRLRDAIDNDLVEHARVEAARKQDLPAIARVRIEEFDERMCVQLLHVGPYSAEPVSIERMRAFPRDQGRIAHGRHHENYVSVPGRTKPERMKTILRQPMR